MFIHMDNQLLRLKYFLSGYYHQDWDIDAGSTNEKDLWEFYFNHEKIQEDKALENDISQLLQCGDELIKSGQITLGFVRFAQYFTQALFAH